jgi:phospholipid/cholesterol/gamma-HCH transport system ATP-binding protein
MIAPRKALIEVEKLSAGYGESLILEDISFQVRGGEIFAILGRSGSGKSTLLKCLIGLIPPASGRIRISGTDVAASTGEERRGLLRRLGVLYQSGALFGSMTVLENVRLPLRELTDLPEGAQDLVAMSKLKLVGLSNAARVMPAELSGGMQKRAALARAMALDPCILFLDEPSVGLDPITSAGLDDLIKELATSFGITFVIVTHELPSLFAIVSRAIFIDSRTKRIIAEGSPAELSERSSNEQVRRFFHREAEPDSAANASASV